MSDAPDNRTAPEQEIDFSRYRVLVAGSFHGSLRQWAGLTELGPQVTVIGMASEAEQKKIRQLNVQEARFVDGPSELAAEAYPISAGAHLVVLVGDAAEDLAAVLRPWMEEEAAASMQSLLPLVMVDDPALRFLRNGEQWAFFLLGRTLGLPPRKAREFMEECCGYQKQDS